MSRCRSCGTPIRGDFIRCDDCWRLSTLPPPPPELRLDRGCVEVGAWAVLIGGLLLAYVLIRAATG